MMGKAFFAAVAARIGQVIYRSRNAAKQVTKTVDKKAAKQEIKPDPRINYRKGHAKEIKSGKISQERKTAREDFKKEHEEYSKKMKEITFDKKKEDWAKDIQKEAANANSNKALGKSIDEIKDQASNLPKSDIPPDVGSNLPKGIVGGVIIQKAISNDETKAKELNNIQELKSEQLKEVENIDKTSFLSTEGKTVIVENEIQGKQTELPDQEKEGLFASMQEFQDKKPDFLTDLDKAKEQEVEVSKQFENNVGNQQPEFIADVDKGIEVSKIENKGIEDSELIDSSDNEVVNTEIVEQEEDLMTAMADFQDSKPDFLNEIDEDREYRNELEDLSFYDEGGYNDDSGNNDGDDGGADGGGDGGGGD